VIEVLAVVEAKLQRPAGLKPEPVQRASAGDGENLHVFPMRCCEVGQDALVAIVSAPVEGAGVLCWQWPAEHSGHPHGLVDLQAGNRLVD